MADIDVAGVDVWTGRWVGVILRDRRYHRGVTAQRIGDLLDGIGDVAAVGIDMPIGLTTGMERRAADAAARAFVGPRRSSVFPTYPREVYLAASYADARGVSVELTGMSISSQAYAIGPRLLELEEAVVERSNVWEVHPEVSFCALAGGPLTWPKASWNGFHERLSLLAHAGIELPQADPALGKVGIEDVLDAAAAAWSARRLADGSARSLPERPTQVVGPRELAIWY